MLGASYQLRKLKLHLIYGIDKGYGSTHLWNTGSPYGGVKPIASTDGRDLLLGLSGRIGPGTLMFSTMRKDDRTPFDQDASSWGIGYDYPLSRRTSLYATYAHIVNRNGAGYTVNNNSEAGNGIPGPTSASCIPSEAHGAGAGKAWRYRNASTNAANAGEVWRRFG